MKVIQCGSFSKASEKLHCTQSAVTQAMNGLERELGVKLLVRSHKGISLTVEGEQLLPSITSVYTAIQSLFEEAERISTGKGRPIRIGTFSSVSTTWLPKAIQEYRQLYPQAGFSIRVGTNVVSDWLLKGEIDIALIDDLRSHSFRFYPLMDDPYAAVFPMKYHVKDTEAISPEMLTEYPFIMAPQNALERLLPKLPKDSITVDTDEDSSILTMVEKGFGVTAMPELCLISVPDTVRVVPIQPEIKRVLGIALPNTPSHDAVQFSRFLQKWFDADQ